MKSIEATPQDAKIEYSTDDNTFSTTMPKITNASSITVTVRASKSGYTTITTKQTAKIEKAEGKLTLSAANGTYTYPTSGTFTVSDNTGTLSAISNNTNIATVSASGNIITVKPGTTEGKATITVKSASNTNYNEKTATYTVTVQYPTFTGNSGVGYYADVDGNGTPDGIIFADLKNGGSGSWGKDYMGGEITQYTIPKRTNLKNYYIVKSGYSGSFGKMDVLAAKGSGNDRFYVMSLKDYNNGAQYTFLKAKSIKSGIWSVPDKTKWVIFAGQLGITTSNYSARGLQKQYWTSTSRQ